ncbi:MAG: GDSL-type esterase/lipase family protein [Anaerolineaceae bacterium]
MKKPEPLNFAFLIRVLAKGLLLFLAANLAAAAWLPFADLGKLTLYNRLLPGRERLPFGEEPQKSYNLSLYNLEAMFASQKIDATPKGADEYRVLVIGDSSVWGTLLKPEQTLAGQLNSFGLQGCGERKVKVYNLGYPTISLTKDLMILDRAVEAYQPDLIVWPLTLEALPRDKQLASPLAANNAAAIEKLIRDQGLSLDPNDPALIRPDFWERTLVGQRRALADLIRLQVYGVMWGATGIDQVYPDEYQKAETDLKDDASFHGWQSPKLSADGLAWETLDAGMRIAGDIPMILVNEPMLLSTGQNSDIRYNFFYPRWAYDAYRAELTGRAREHGWNLLDLWDLVPAGEFTNSAIHLTPYGETLLAREVADAILKQTCADASEQADIQLDGESAVPSTDLENMKAEPTPTPKISPTPAPTLDLEAVIARPNGWMELPAVPDFTRTAGVIYRKGISDGRDPRAFSKIGDCESTPTWFLGDFDLGPKHYDLGPYPELQEVIDSFPGSFGRVSVAARPGFKTSSALSPLWADRKVCEAAETPLDCEYRLQNPAFAFIMLGTNDVAFIDTYEANLRQVIEKTMAAGIVPILATKADNLEGNHAINAITARLAVEYDLPMWNFWKAVQGLPNNGLQEDKVHLTVAGSRFGDRIVMFSGWPVRNLTALQTLEAMLEGVKELN